MRSTFFEDLHLRDISLVNVKSICRCKLCFLWYYCNNNLKGQASRVHMREITQN